MNIDDKDYLEETFRKEVLKSMDDKLSKKEKEELLKEADVSLNFINNVEKVELPTDNYVIFTDGKEQLIYENGEFYVVSATDSLRQRKKKTKKEATDMYLDFFIKYQLNPILDARQSSTEPVKQKTTRAKTQKQVTKTVEPKVDVSVKNMKEDIKKEVEEKQIEQDEPTL